MNRGRILQDSKKLYIGNVENIAEYLGFSGDEGEPSDADIESEATEESSSPTKLNAREITAAQEEQRLATAIGNGWKRAKHKETKTRRIDGHFNEDKAEEGNLQDMRYFSQEPVCKEIKGDDLIILDQQETPKPPRSEEAKQYERKAWDNLFLTPSARVTPRATKTKKSSVLYVAPRTGIFSGNNDSGEETDARYDAIYSVSNFVGA